MDHQAKQNDSAPKRSASHPAPSESVPQPSGKPAHKLGRRAIVVVFLAALVAVIAMFALQDASPRPRIAFVTSSTSQYWDPILAGARAAADEFDAELLVYKADGSFAGQNRILSDISENKPDGVAVSPLDPGRQAALLHSISEQTRLVTVDSDSEFSERMCFVGMDNYDAGRVCAELVRSALPEGGRVLIVTGPLSKENGRDRRQGLIDSLLGREYQRVAKIDPVDAELAGEGFVIPYTLVHEVDSEEAATAEVASIFEKDSNFDCVVGMYAYHAAAIWAALKETDRAGEIKIIGFDVLPDTLELIESGAVYGTVAQDQYQYGYQSVRILAQDTIGKDGTISVPFGRRLLFAATPVTIDSRKPPR